MICIWALPLASCGALGKLLHLPVPQVPHLQNGDDHELLGLWSQMTTTWVAYNNSNFFSHSSGGQDFEIRVLVGPCSL